MVIALTKQFTVGTLIHTNGQKSYIESIVDKRKQQVEHAMEKQNKTVIRDANSDEIVDERLHKSDSSIKERVNVTNTKRSNATRNELVNKQSVVLQQGNNTLVVSPNPNHTLLDSALMQKQPIAYKCKRGTCGQCTVRVLEGGHLLSPPNTQEQKKLNQKLSDHYRLACQAMVGQ